MPRRFAIRFFGLFSGLFAALMVQACVPAATEYAPLQTAPPQTTAPSLQQTQSVLADSPPPVGTARATRENDRIYIVEPGDSLLAIAHEAETDIQHIAAANSLEPPYIIEPGQQLVIPGGRYHEVKAGDTGIAIARDYGAPWGEIVRLNDLEEPFTLHVGQRLKLPVAQPVEQDAAASAGSIEQRAASFDLNIDDIATDSEPATPVALANSEVSDWRRATAPTPEKQEDQDSAAGADTRQSAAFIWPVEGRLLAGYGSLGEGKVNDGINIAVPADTPIRAAAAGTVIYSADEMAVFGGLILIKHDDGLMTAYGHVGQLNVIKGQEVMTGDIIALSGNSGLVIEPQLHFEIRKDGKPVDPMVYLSPASSDRT